jgi:hypothetical protein
MSELIAKLNRHVETIAAHRRPEILKFLMLCFATATMATQAGAKTSTALLAIFTAFCAMQVIDGDRELHKLTPATVGNYFICSALLYLSAGDLGQLLALSGKLSPAGQANSVELVRCAGIGSFIVSCAYAVTAFVSNKLDWTRS